MIPLRLAVDTNVVVSAALKPESLQRTTFLLAITKPARLYVSRPILDEYADVLSRPELKIRKGLRRQFLQLIKNRGNLVPRSFAASKHSRAAFGISAIRAFMPRAVTCS
jgi:predicted nucleic acid-binding protein